MAMKKSKAEVETKFKAKAPVAPPKVEAPKAKVKAKAEADTAAKADTPKVAPKPALKSAPAAKADSKKAVTVKLTDKQKSFLASIKTAEGGYKAEKKAEAKAIESLLGKKLIKKGAKDKASGVYRYTVSKAGEKHLTDAPAS